MSSKTFENAKNVEKKNIKGDTSSLLTKRTQVDVQNYNLVL